MTRVQSDRAAVPRHLDVLRLSASWGAARFVTWKQFIKYWDNRSQHYSAEAVARIDRIFEHHDVNKLIETRIAMLKSGSNLVASRIRADLLAAGVELIDQRAAKSGTVTTRWELTR